MSYRVVHLLEAAYWLDDLEYSQMVDQCEQIFRYVSEDKACKGQTILTFADTVKELGIENGFWPGEGAFIRKRRADKEKSRTKKVCFEEALSAIAGPMQVSTDTWIVIVYTAGCVKRSKRTLLAKWKKRLWVPIVQLAVASESADASFLDSYTEPDKRFQTAPQAPVIDWLKTHRELFVR